MRVTPWLLAFLLSACSDEDPPVAPPAAPPAAAPLKVDPPEAWSKEIRPSEEAASQTQKDLTRPLCHALRGEDPPALRALLTPDFEGRGWAAAETPVQADHTLRVARLEAAQAPLDRAGFAEALLAARGRFAVLRRCSLAPFRFRLGEPRRDSAWARLSLRLVGQDADGRPLTWDAVWTVNLAKLDGKWRLQRARLEPVKAVTTLVEPFRDVSAEVGVGLHRDAAAAQAVTHQSDEQRLETVGGIAVVDADADGHPDVLAWNRRRTLQLFRNDGQGGFLKEPDLLPPSRVGYQQILADLDGDGRAELLSTELVRCARGKGRFDIYRREGARFEPVAPLEFEFDCVDPARALFQHIALADVNRDGRLDVLVAGFGNHMSRNGNFNHFDTHRGERNLLFINQGGLRFTEEGRARGLISTRLTYVSTFFDYDGDGDDDVYFANDFGPNELYANDGAGHFTMVSSGPMAENGQSMGLTVADFDGDLDLDVYVSNMYSKAGKRIVPLAEGQVSAEVFQALNRLAAGNALYAWEDGAWVERAEALGVAKAGWAWGQAFFDADNDGDRDLYVVNGMTSHSRIKEADF